MAETLYPARQRCKKCGKGFPSSGALLGLYCSTSCAGREGPARNIEAAPRGCKTDRGSGGNTWHWKRKYSSELEIPPKIKNDPSSKWYWCEEAQGCLRLHIGHSRVDFTKETLRVVRDRSELADVLVKARGAATHREIGAKSKLQPIRIKELEDPKGKVGDLNVLFKLLAFYRLKISVVFS